MTNKRNNMVVYHGVQLQILLPLLQFPKMMCNQLIYNLLIWNNRDDIPQSFKTRNNVIHVQTNKCNNAVVKSVCSERDSG